MDTNTLINIAVLVVTIISIPTMIWAGRHSVRYAKKLSDQPGPSTDESHPDTLIQRIKELFTPFATSPSLNVCNEPRK